MKPITGSIILLTLVASTSICKSAEHRKNGKDRLPKGIVLNLDFQQIKDGLIPNKVLYPLYVPANGLGTETVNNREILVLREGQSLDIPHSSLLDPDGSQWVAIIRVFLKSDGIVLSQGNGQQGYAIYTKEGVVHVAIRTGDSTVVLKETLEKGITDYLGKWVTIELRIKQGIAILNLNRARVATLPVPSPLSGKDCKIRIGEHRSLPIALENNTDASPAGFTGAVSSLKILRQ